ncbi:hypothetical protein [Cellulomonas aerilata]|uniref:Uncharacterized protein n=1 Tax=Cellulomonas aerilata TaxID=515326 RepID=A0A512D9T6_9CELL|nr:hypothetical protein [Cellulomonas aerilata]GEO33229.1 hypothetical protein CAE01nite_09540 [Cellulomonas aerilata]
MPSTAPDVLPLLARGKHRSPRRGACFMELASYLAGERWSDHPACTHPVLARLARGVNDATSDDARPRLARYIPSVIGLTSADPRWDHEIAVVAACAALPVAAEERQRVLAVGLLACERLLAVADGRDPADLRPAARAALADVPLAARWAERFTREHGLGGSTRDPAPAVVDFAVQALALSAAPDTDARLATVLEQAVAVCRTLAGAQGDPVPDLDGSPWARICPPAVPTPVR